MKQLANLITLSRIVFAIIMILVVPFSSLFWLLYTLAGVSDIVDGYVARKLNQQSIFGSKLDSIADFLFAFAILFVVVRNIHIPLWLWVCAVLIALLRIIAYGVGFYKYHTFSALHTVLNKLVGGLLFVFPLLYLLLGLNVTGVLLSFIALVSAIEELVITINSKTLNRDCKGIIN